LSVKGCGRENQLEAERGTVGAETAHDISLRCPGTGRIAG
jgi:hypothetical protein